MLHLIVWGDQQIYDRVYSICVKHPVDEMFLNIQLILCEYMRALSRTMNI